MVIDKVLLDEIIKYIENTEESFDGEYGEGRSVWGLIKDNKMPDIYHKLCALRSGVV